MKPRNSSAVLVCVTDLFFSERIRTALEAQGSRALFVEGDHHIPVRERNRKRPPQNPPGSPGETPADGFVRVVADLSPNLVVIDLNDEAIPWREWVPALKDHPSTGAIPIVTFGSHKNIENQRAAHQLGADHILTNDRFFQELPALVEKYGQNRSPAQG